MTANGTRNESCFDFACELPNGNKWYHIIILCVKYKNLTAIDFLRMRNRIIKHPVQKLIPPRTRRTVRHAIGLEHKRNPIFHPLCLAVLAPINNRRNGNYFVHPRIPRRKNDRRSAKTGTYEQDILRSYRIAFLRPQISEPLRQCIDHIYEVLIKRLLQKYSFTLPCSSIANMECGVALLCKKSHHVTIARCARRSIAKNRDFRRGPVRQQNFREYFFLKKRPEDLHTSMIFLKITQVCSGHDHNGTLCRPRELSILPDFLDQGDQASLQARQLHQGFDGPDGKVDLPPPPRRKLHRWILDDHNSITRRAKQNSARPATNEDSSVSGIFLRGRRPIYFFDFHCCLLWHNKNSTQCAILSKRFTR